VQVPGGPAGSGCLRRVPLGRAQVGDVLDQGGEACDERELGEAPIAGKR